MQRLWDIKAYTEDEKKIAERKQSSKVKGTYPQREGHINGIRGVFKYSLDSCDPLGSEARYTEYVVLPSPSREGDWDRFGRSGESGSLVTGHEGAAIGMIIAGEGCEMFSYGMAVFTPLEEIFEGIKGCTEATTVSLAQ